MIDERYRNIILLVYWRWLAGDGRADSSGNIFNARRRSVAAGVFAGIHRGDAPSRRP